MPLAELMGVPLTRLALAGWQFAHVANHRDIIRRVQETKGILLEEHSLDFDPEDEASLNNFLNANQDLHTDMDRALGLKSYNLSEVDWSDTNALAQWIQAHAIEHMAASALLGVS